MVTTAVEARVGADEGGGEGGGPPENVVHLDALFGDGGDEHLKRDGGGGEGAGGDGGGGHP